MSPRDECSEYFQVMIKWIYLSQVSHFSLCLQKELVHVSMPGLLWCYLYFKISELDRKQGTRLLKEQISSLGSYFFKKISIKMVNQAS